MEKQEGLLFRLSGQQGSCPETAGGDPVPNFFKDIEIIDSGVKGKALRCLPTQLLAYWAPGNIYSQQGTVAFFWRSRTPLGERNSRCFGCLLQITAAGTLCLCELIIMAAALMPLLRISI